MNRQYTRLDEARSLIDPIIKAIPDEENKRSAYVHLYGVGLLAALLAVRRGHSRETAELAEVAGMLHDLLCYVDPSEDTPDHAHTCADYAKTHVLCKLTGFSETEKEKIYTAICHHSDKNIAGDWFDEIVKDADAAQHALRNPMEDFFYLNPRVKRAVRALTENED